MLVVDVVVVELQQFVIVSWFEINMPAIQAVIKQAAEPATIALNAIIDKSDFRFGAMEPNDPSCIPIELKLEKPHNA